MAQTPIRQANETCGMIMTPMPGVARTVINVTFSTGSSNPGFQDRIVVVGGRVPPDASLISRYIEAERHAGGIRRPRTRS